MSPESSFPPVADPVWLRDLPEDYTSSVLLMFDGENVEFEHYLADHDHPCWPVLPPAVEDEALRGGP